MQLGLIGIDWVYGFLMFIGKPIRGEVFPGAGFVEGGPPRFIIPSLKPGGVFLAYCHLSQYQSLQWHGNNKQTTSNNHIDPYCKLYHWNHVHLKVVATNERLRWWYLLLHRDTVDGWCSSSFSGSRPERTQGHFQQLGMCFGVDLCTIHHATNMSTGSWLRIFDTFEHEAWISFVYSLVRFLQHVFLMLGLLVHSIDNFCLFYCAGLPSFPYMFQIRW